MCEDTKSYELTIILPDGTRRAITQLHVTDSWKMLGVWSSPNGSDKKHLQEVVMGKTTKWVGRLKNSHLPVHLAWKAYCFQLWPCRKPLINVPYKRTFGVPDQGQTLDV
jgi:hypothetical protein